jgi:hypothetical protein
MGRSNVKWPTLHFILNHSQATVANVYLALYRNPTLLSHWRTILTSSGASGKFPPDTPEAHGEAGYMVEDYTS